MRNYELIQSKIEAGIEAAKKEIEVRGCFFIINLPVRYVLTSVAEQLPPPFDSPGTGSHHFGGGGSGNL